MSLVNVLSIEHFYNGEDKELAIVSEKTIITTLTTVVNNVYKVALYYNDNKDFIITTIINIDDENICFELSPDRVINDRILNSEYIIIVTIVAEIKIQFVIYNTKPITYKNYNCITSPIPESILRIQRREFFRIKVPISTPIYCDIQIPSLDPELPDHNEKVDIKDISGGGIAFVVNRKDFVFKLGETFKDCKIFLEKENFVLVDLEIVYIVDLDNNIRRLGCKFRNLSNPVNTKLQRFIRVLQSNLIK